MQSRSFSSGVRLGVLSGIVLVLGACSQRIPNPPRPPATLSGAELLPAHLDASLRLNLSKARQIVESQQWQEGLALLVPSAKDPSFVVASQQAEKLWVGMRFSDSPEEVDSVLVLEGSFHGFEFDETWGSVSLQGGGLRVRDKRRHVPRWAPSRVYARHENTLVFSSEAEIDSLERMFQGRASPGAKSLPERGALAFLVRLPALASSLARESPKAARLLKKGSTLEGYVDLDPSGLRASLSFEFDRPDTARRSVEAATLLVDALKEGSGLLAQLAKSAVISHVESTVLLRFGLSRHNSNRAFGCVDGTSACP